MPEAGDQYIGAEIMFPRGDQMARGHVVAQSGNASGNIMGRAHANHIMETRMLLLNQWMPNVMPIEMSIYSLTCLLIIIKITKPFP